MAVLINISSLEGLGGLVRYNYDLSLISPAAPTFPLTNIHLTKNGESLDSGVITDIFAADAFFIADGWTVVTNGVYHLEKTYNAYKTDVVITAGFTYNYFMNRVKVKVRADTTAAILHVLDLITDYYLNDRDFDDNGRTWDKLSALYLIASMLESFQLEVALKDTEIATLIAKTGLYQRPQIRGIN